MVDNFTTHNFLISFIDEFRQLPCLWQVKSADYKNRKLRKQAMEHLVAFYKPVCPGANFEYIRKKINSIRTAYRRELKKIEDSTQSGAGARNVHVPRLWYFDNMRFLADTMESRPSISTLPSTSAEGSVSVDPSQDEDFLEESFTQVWHFTIYCLLKCNHVTKL